SLTLGDVDKTKIDGKITFNKLVNNIGFWTIGLDDASVNKKALNLGKRNAIIDTGTTLAIIPPNDAEKIHNKIPGAVVVQNQFCVPCNTTASVAFTFGGVSYSIDSRDITFQPIGQDNLCVSGIAGGNIAGNDTWLVGDTFLKNVYSVFNIVDLTVGFANLKK
ncbi:5742_t:CDS:1, partial [Cetraspora pellucida]